MSKDDRTEAVGSNAGSMTLELPIVTDWLTEPQDAVPGSGLDGD